MPLFQPATFTFWTGDGYQLNYNVGHREFEGILARPPLDKPKLGLPAGYITFTLPRPIYADFRRRRWAKVGVVTADARVWWHVQEVHHIHASDMRHMFHSVLSPDDWAFWGEHWQVACEVTIKSIEQISN